MSVGTDKKKYTYLIGYKAMLGNARLTGRSIIEVDKKIEKATDIAKLDRKQSNVIGAECEVFSFSLLEGE